MEKIRRVNKPEMACVIDTYQFSNEMVISDIPKFVETLKAAGVNLRNFRLSNSEREEEHFFRTFSTLNDFESYTWDGGYLIDDFGVSCMYNRIFFNLTFNFNTDHVLVFHQNNINVEPLLIAMESAVQKKTR